MTYPPAVQALLDACEAVPLVRMGTPEVLVIPQHASVDLARAIDHYRAAKAEGFIPSVWISTDEQWREAGRRSEAERALTASQEELLRLADETRPVMLAAKRVYDQWRKAGVKPDTDMPEQRALYEAVDALLAAARDGTRTHSS